jgi:hypothetical protein
MMYISIPSVITVFLVLTILSGCKKEETQLGGTDRPVKVEIRTTASGFEMLRGGRPYFIKGAGGSPSLLRDLSDAGGNSLRTWGTGDLLPTLNEAHRLGITVMVGLSMPAERGGFNYSNTGAVDQLKANIMAEVRQYKNHPAVLLWALGNELDLNYTNTAVWDVVEDLARMIKAEDPNHPVTTVLAGVDRTKVQLVRDRAPSLDLLGVNVYGSIMSLPGQLQEYGWDRPYIVAEWGPTGHWEVARAPWGAPVEQTSAEKAVSYRDRYALAILADQNRNLGSYAFLWGQKQETTHTWYGLFTETGEATEGVDVLQQAWKGAFPSNRAPKVEQLRIGTQEPGADIRLTAGNIYSATATGSDPNNDTLTWSWEISAEGGGGVGGDAEARPQPIAGLFINQNPGLLRFEAPANRGAYRLFVKVTDGKGKAGTANIPFFVN